MWAAASFSLPILLHFLQLQNRLLYRTTEEILDTEKTHLARDPREHTSL
jgi:hypothetical protein